jgi:hypothetical protein
MKRVDLGACFTISQLEDELELFLMDGMERREDVKIIMSDDMISRFDSMLFGPAYPVVGPRNRMFNGVRIERISGCSGYVLFCYDGGVP